MQEAMGSASGEAGTPYPSAGSYAHFIRARLAHHEGDHRGSLDELRLALASDDANPYLLTELAEQYARLSELDRAETYLRRVIERHPDYAPAQLLMGRVLYEGQKLVRARAHLAKAIKLRPHDADAYLVMTQLWLDQNRFDDAVRVVEELGTAIPGEPLGYRRLGIALVERGEPVRAERMLTRAVDRDPGDLEAWTTLARLYESSARYDKALEAWNQAVQRDPENRDVLLSTGRLAIRMERLIDAKAYFDQLLSLGRDPETAVKVAFSYLALHHIQEAASVLETSRRQLEEPRLHFYSGLVHERARNFDQAVAAFDAVPKELKDLSMEARLHKAMCQSAMGNHRQAIEGFIKLGEERPSMAGLTGAWARALERANRPKEAETLLLRSFHPKPHPEVLEALSGLYQRQGRSAEAVVLFSEALANNPKDEPLLFALSAAYERKGEWQRAVDTMRSVLVENPTNTQAMNFIGYTMADRGSDLEEAERLVAKALEAKPDSASYLDSMGWVAFRKGQFDRAVDLLEKAVAEAPEEPTLLEHLAEACTKAGKKPRAEAALRRAIRVLNENPEASDRPLQRAELEKKLRAL
jgi:tetratricopeptide (TPR) repeat protein